MARKTINIKVGERLELSRKQLQWLLSKMDDQDSRAVVERFHPAVLSVTSSKARLENRDNPSVGLDLDLNVWPAIPGTTIEFKPFIVTND